MKNVLNIRRDKEKDVDEVSNKSLDSLLQDDGSSLESSPDSLGSSFYMDRLNILTMDKILLGGKKLFKGKQIQNK